jgi:hypothetical protein
MSRSRTLLILCVIAVLAESLLWPQTSTAQAAAPQLSDARAACASDVQKLCPNVPPGGGRILACLKQHRDEVSDGCKRAIVSAMGKSSGDASSTASPALAAANPAPPAAPASASPAPSAAPVQHQSDAGSASTAPSSSPSKSSLPSKQKSHASSTASAVPGEHYFLMKQVKIIDQGIMSLP